VDTPETNTEEALSQFLNKFLLSLAALLGNNFNVDCDDILKEIPKEGQLPAQINVALDLSKLLKEHLAELTNQS